jgi:hypothetical protein
MSILYKKPIKAQNGASTGNTTDYIKYTNDKDNSNLYRLNADNALNTLRKVIPEYYESQKRLYGDDKLKTNTAPYTEYSISKDAANILNTIHSGGNVDWDNVLNTNAGTLAPYVGYGTFDKKYPVNFGTLFKNYNELKPILTSKNINELDNLYNLYNERQANTQ